MRSHGWRRWPHLSVLAATAALVAFLVAHGALADSNTDYTGTWSEVAICTTQACEGTHYPSVWTLTQTGSSISGTVSDNATVTGTVSGSTATMTSTLGSYTAHLTVTLSADGSTWSGTFNDTKQVSGTTNASRLRRSATQVNCNLIGPDSPNAYFQCTAQVADASGNAQSDIPTGTVSFAINAGGGGGFQGSGTCTLAPSQSGPTSFCSVNYLPPPGGIPIGSQPPLTASYSGDSVLAPSSAQPQSGIVTETPTPTTIPPPVPPPTTMNIADCAGNTPVDNVTAPAPPTTPTATTANVPLARIADPPTVIAPTYCPYRAKYTKEEKAAAAQWADFYNTTSAADAKGAAVMGGLAAAATTVPDPTVSKAAAVGYGILGAIAAYHSADFNAMGVQQGIINRDPPDPDWRTIVAPPKVSPNRFPRVPGLSHGQQASLHAYLTAVLNNTSENWCVGTSINRATTALGQANVVVAKAQYHAGALCAAASMRLQVTLPRLARAAKGPLMRLVPHISSPALTRLLSKDERSAAFRRKVAAQEVALVRRVIALPASALVQLQATIAGAPATSSSLSTAPRLLIPSASSDASATLLEKLSEQVLAASG